MDGHLSRIAASAAWMMGLAAVAMAQDAAGQAGGEKQPPIAAVVNGDPIYVAELEANYRAVASRRRLDEARVDQSKAELLEQLVNRRLVLLALERSGNYVEAAELDSRMEDARAKVKEQYKATLAEYAQRRGVTVDSLRKELFWQLGWDRYLERNLANALEGYFNQHKKDLDGTQVRASHILLRPERFNETPPQLEARARKIRQQIDSGKTTFEDAAAKYSVGPSRAKGGDLGFFPRHGAMIDAFSKTAFALEKGEISEPLNTVFGTHLILVTDVKPGTRQWTQVIPQIRTVAAADLFEKFAERERESATIKYTGNTPYLEPGTGELVLPRGQQAATQ